MDFNFSLYYNFFPNEITKITEYYESEHLSGFAIRKDLIESPYKVMIDYGGISFKRADSLITTKHRDMLTSRQRCCYACYHILGEIESAGSTRMIDKELADALHKLAPQCMGHIVDVVKEDSNIYYDEERHLVSLYSTYQQENYIAKHIKCRLEDVEPSGMDWTKYDNVDNKPLTDEQKCVLKTVSENDICALTAAGGCVDCDTEFFNGYGWKKISDYTVGDMVLQYNEDNTTSLVSPLRYIKEQCNTLYHFETKYGINQTVCDKHNIVYWTPNGIKKECHISDIINKQNGDGYGWNGKFKTSFSYNGDGINLTDNEIRLMGAIICDGSFIKTSKNRCRFHIKKERKKERLRYLFQSCNIEWKEHQSATEGYSDFYITSPLKTKKFDSYWYNCSNAQLKIICDEIIFWDGSTNFTENNVIRKRFSTTIEDTANFVQFAFSACGYKANILINDRAGQHYITCGKEYVRKSIEYVVSITSRDMVGLCCDSRITYKKTRIEEIPTNDGYKYCFTVPSHMLVLRRNGCIFITGNCGKSFTTNAVIQMLDDNDKSYTLLAPTGIASKVLAKNTNRQASTIHKFIMSKCEAGEYVIIDEVSMVSVSLMSLLLTKVGYDSKLVFIADEAQLAAIQFGNIIQDIVDSGVVPNAKLTKVFRYGEGGISTISTDMRKGSIEHLTDKFDDYEFIPIQSTAVQQAVEQYDKLIKSGYTQDDIVVLCPYNKSNIGAAAINKAISNKYNDNPTVRINSDIKIGSRVINIVNDYSDSEHFIANGDIGIVKAYKYTKKKGAEIKVKFDNGLHNVDSLSKLLLAYSLSIHKSQGSQHKAVVVVIDQSHSWLISRNLIYVACSRAQERLIMISDPSVIQKGLSVVQNRNRNTWLKELLLDKSK